MARLTKAQIAEQDKARETLREHLLDTFNDDQSITGIAFIADNGVLVAAPTWNATAFDDDGGAWVCSQCGSAELVDDESHPITRGIDVNKSAADLIAFDGMGECWYESASDACIECRDCGARMDYPADIDREYGLMAGQESRARHMREADEAAARGAASVPDTLGLPLRVGEARHYRTGESFGRGLEILNVDGLTVGNALPHARPEIVRMVNAYPAMLAALRYAQGEACGGCGDCLICRTLKEAE